MTGVVLKAEKREKLGSIANKKIKQEGKIPAVIYQAGGNVNIAVNAKEFEVEYFKGNAKASVIELEIGGKKIKAIAHKIDLDPVSDRPIHIDFLNCAESKTIKAQPKLKFTNQDKSPGLKKGGFLHVVLRKVSVICDSANNVPSEVEVNIGSMQVGQKIRAKDLTLPEGVKFAKNNDFLVASMIGRVSKTDDEAKAGAAPAANAAPATKTDKK
jgi:large subunit ribosomal protein L25